MQQVVANRALPLLAVAGFLVLIPTCESLAQLPEARLFSIFPPGGKQGTTVEVVLTGSDLEDVNQLYFDHPGLHAEPVTAMKDGKLQPVPAKFKVTIEPATPLGMHDVRAVGRYGISNPRIFVVGDGIEVNETEPNNTPAQAVRVLADRVPRVTVNGQINGATDIDQFRFSARAGQRILIDCLARRIDSRLDGRLVLLSPSGKQLAGSDDFKGRDPFLDVTIPADGDYVVGITDQVYDGSPEYFYRLTIGTLPYIDYVYPPVAVPGATSQFTLFGRNLPGGQLASSLLVDGRPLEQLKVQIAVPEEPLSKHRLDYSGRVPARQSMIDGFEYRLTTPQGSSNSVLIGVTDLPVVEAIENATPEKAQAVTPPCEICGRFDSPRDFQWFRFNAKANEVWMIESLSQRAGFPTDLFLTLRRVKDGAEIGTADDDGTSPIGTRFVISSDDPVLRTPQLAEGEYLVGVRHLYTAIKPNARLLYRLRIRPVQPDFSLLVLHNAPGQPNAAEQPGSLLVRRGGNQHLDVYAVRRDGFNGEIAVKVDGLPAGVTCSPVTLGPGLPGQPGQIHTPLVFSAANDAPIATGTLTITGTATIDGKPVVREARAGVATWGFAANQPFLGQSRLARSIPIAVREGAPYRVVAMPAQETLSRGMPLKVKLELTRYGEFKDQVAGITAVSLPPNARNATVVIPAGKNDGELSINLPPNVAVGTYTIAFRGNAPAVPFTKDSDGKNKKNVQVADISTPVILTVTDPIALSVDPSSAAVKQGDNVEATVAITRQGKFTGPVQLQFVQLPANVKSTTVTVAAESNEGKLVITSDANAAKGSFSNTLLRASVQVAGQGINIDKPFPLKIE
jgi:hypothetical protein